MRILLTIAIALWCALAQGQSIAIPGSSVMWQKAATSPCGVLFCENFEGWTNWTRQNTSPYYTNVNNWLLKYTTSSAPASTITNFPTTGLSLEGLNCLQMIDPSGDFPFAVSPSFAAQSECWVYLEIRFHGLAAGTVFHTLDLLDGSSNQVAAIFVDGSGDVEAFNGSGSTSASVTKLTVDTTYFFWMHYIAGSGANGTTTIGFNSAASRPTSGNNFVSITTGNATTGCVYIRLSPGQDAGGQFYDKIRVYSGSTPPPDNPP